MKTIMMMLFCSILCMTINAQRRTASYFEAFGTGLVYSVNIDTRFQNKVDGIGGRIGFSFLPASKNSEDPMSLITIPLGINYIFGNKHALELGVGATIMMWDSSFDKEGIMYNSTIAYRLHTKSGFMLRAAFSPYVLDGGFMPWGGLGIGVHF